MECSQRVLLDGCLGRLPHLLEGGWLQEAERLQLLIDLAHVLRDRRWSPLPPLQELAALDLLASSHQTTQELLFLLLKLALDAVLVAPAGNLRHWEGCSPANLLFEAGLRLFLLLNLLLPELLILGGAEATVILKDLVLLKKLVSKGSKNVINSRS